MCCPLFYHITMNKYKVEFTQTAKYAVDVLAEDEQEATDKASVEFTKICGNGIDHLYQTEAIETNVSQVYNVTNTDDPFNP